MPAIAAFGRLTQKDCHDFKASLGLYGNYQAQQKLHRKREERKEGGREGERKEGRKKEKEGKGERKKKKKDDSNPPEVVQHLRGPGASVSSCILG